MDFHFEKKAVQFGDKQKMIENNKTKSLNKKLVSIIGNTIWAIWTVLLNPANQ